MNATAHETYDRVDLIRDLDERCLGRDAESAVLVCAHKVGKTHILQHLERERLVVGENLYCKVDTDILRSVAEPVTDSSFLRFLLEELLKQLEARVLSLERSEARRTERASQTGGDQAAELGKEAVLLGGLLDQAYGQNRSDLESLRAMADEIRSLIERDVEIGIQTVRPLFSRLHQMGKRLILVIDEFQRLIREPKLSRRLFLFLRGANNNREIVSLVSSTVNLMDDSLHVDTSRGEDSRSLFNHYLFKSVVPFDEGHSRGFLGFIEPKVELDAEEQSYLFRVGGGSAHFLKLAKTEYVAFGRPRSESERQAFEREKLVPIFQAGFHALWRRCDDSKRRLLEKISRGGMPAESLALDLLVAEGFVRRTLGEQALFSPLFGDFVRAATATRTLWFKQHALEKVRLLFLAANPEDQVRLNLDKEANEIEKAIKLSGAAERMEFITKRAVKSDELVHHLLENEPEIVHFSGHGSDAEELILVGEDDTATSVSTAAIETLFRALKDNVRVVVFNACFSEAQARAVTRHIPCAIGMVGEIGEKAARAYAVAFYQALSFGRSVETAHDLGKTALAMLNNPKELMPRLLLGRDIDPAEIRLLRRQDEAADSD